MKHITRENMPCWYELSWNKKRKAISIRLHEFFVRSIPSIKETAPMVIRMQKEFGLKSFSGDIRGETWGFENAFLKQGDDGNLSIFHVPLPKIHRITDKPCRRCRGKKREEHSSRECSGCDGSGKETENDWHGAYALSATFSLFTMLSRYPGVEIEHNGPPQLLTFQTITDHGQHGGSLDGEFSIPFCSWLGALPPNQSIKEVEGAMMNAYSHMFKVRGYTQHDFRAVQRGSGIIHARCPGDACEIHPKHPQSEPLKNQGGEFTCHNVDSPLQQLTFVAGLAALHDKARKEMRC